MISVKYNLSGLKKTVKKIRAIKSIVNDIVFRRDLAKFTRDMVYKRVKSGKGVDSDSKDPDSTTAVRLKPLSKNYKYYRKTGKVRFKARKFNGTSAAGRRWWDMVDVEFSVGKPSLGPYGSPDRSNLTFTGQLLESMSFDITTSGFKVLIPNNKRRGSNLTNSQLAKYVSQNGRPFMALTSGEFRVLKLRMKKNIQKRLRELLRRN